MTLIASGTATLEAALFKRPMVIGYRMHPLSWQLMKATRYQPWVGLPNILCRDFVVPELLQAIFQAPRPAGAGKVSAGVATLASGDPAVFVVSSANPGTPAAFGGNLSEQAQNLATQNAAIEFDAYLTELRRTAKIKRNDKVFAAE